MRRFTRTPYYTGKDDPERGQVRGTLKLGETVIIETPGGADGDLYPGVVPELTEPRGSRGGAALAGRRPSARGGGVFARISGDGMNGDL